MVREIPWSTGLCPSSQGPNDVTMSISDEATVTSYWRIKEYWYSPGRREGEIGESTCHVIQVNTLYCTWACTSSSRWRVSSLAHSQALEILMSIVKAFGENLDITKKKTESMIAFDTILSGAAAEV
ncbi:hypothetical protein RRG08_044652 [Elysia crispata]|uniref:Uncharacterized protein n=1 Tax=Elysia crispata TaxID=231223 RepID=A0AAE1EA17_9GAST|nr:hypothetical protein RRG08_044652 [Elysia crispata]